MAEGTAVQTIASGSHAVGTHNGDAIGVEGYSVQVYLDAGDCSAGTVSVHLEESEDGVTWTDVAGAVFTPVTGANDNAVYGMAYTGGESYLRAVAVVETGACTFGVWVIAYDVTLASNALCSLAEAKAFLNIPAADAGYDSILTTLINYASTEIERYVGTNIINAEHTDVYDGTGGNVLIPDHWPIVEVTTFQIDDEDVGTEGTDYYVYDSYIYSEATLTEGHQNIDLAYTSGWGADRDSVGKDFKFACIKLVAYWHRKDVAAYSDTYGEPEETRLPAWPMPAAVRSLLDPYAKVNV